MNGSVVKPSILPVYITPLKYPFVQDICTLSEVLIIPLISSLLLDKGIPMVDLAL